MSETAICGHPLGAKPVDGFCSIFCRALARSAAAAPEDVRPELPAEPPPAAPPAITAELRDVLARADALEAEQAELRRVNGRSWGHAVLNGKKS